MDPQDVNMEAPNIKANQLRPQKRWIDDITAVFGKNWVRSAQDWEAWKIREGPTFSNGWIKAEEEEEEENMIGEETNFRCTGLSVSSVEEA